MLNLFISYKKCRHTLQRLQIIPRLHDQANIEQTSSKRQANIKQLEHTSCTCILNTFA